MADVSSDVNNRFNRQGCASINETEFCCCFCIPVTW